MKKNKKIQAVKAWGIYVGGYLHDIAFTKTQAAQKAFGWILGWEIKRVLITPFNNPKRKK